MVPCICHKCSGIYTGRVNFGVPEHRFFCSDGDYSSHESKDTRDGQIGIMSACNCFDCGYTYGNTCDEKDDSKDDRCNTFQSLMTIWMFFVGFFG